MSVKITYELDLENFEAWSGAVETLDRIKIEGKCADLEFILEDMYPDGMTETQLNDLLWFEEDWIYEVLGIRTEEEIKEELEEAKEELAELYKDMEEATDEPTQISILEDIECIKERIEELKEELSNI